MFASPAHDDWHSEAYVSDWIERDVTQDRERRPMLRPAARLVPLAREARRAYSTSLDVGGGYGKFTRQILEAYPTAR